MLRIENLKKAFTEPGGEPLPILDIPRFEVGEGEQVVVVGRSGCGKTTLLHVVAGIIRASSGKVEVAGIDISRLTESARDRFRADKLGYVFQTFNLLPAFTALENVMLGMTFASRKPDHARAVHLLERVGLSHRLHHKPKKMSVGEQQRVAVARALANRPMLLLADEPTANVDARHQKQIIDLIRDTCHEEKISLMLVTHTADVMEQFDRVENLKN
jgi:ABC-type lipoprotein export system ATPase subunit